MKNIPYASAVGSIMYAQVYTRPDIADAVGVLRRYQSNPGLDNWKAAKKVLRYLQGYVFMIADGAMSWRSVKQTLTATSTMEAESLRMYCDNSAVVFMAKNNRSRSRSEHIDIKYLAIRERVQEKKVIIEHISTELMIADPLTKGMPIKTSKDHVVRMGLGSIM
ncbi:secreted RxLR effector protein 161-like [Silene latifolia]|uniref:secreted RxLR effector protein 161-like n=1 Tax=Silene latifolia TaxID=37657 RepID=UPI003D780CDB